MVEDLKNSLWPECLVRPQAEVLLHPQIAKSPDLQQFGHLLCSFVTFLPLRFRKKTACLELVFVASKAQTLGQPMATAASPPPGVPSLRDTHRHVKDFKHSGLRETAVRWLALRRIRTCMKKVAVQKFLWKSDVKEASFRNRSQGAHIKHLVQQKSCPQVWHLSCIQADGGQFCLLNSDIDCCRCCGCRSVSHVSLCLECFSFQFLSSAPPQHVCFEIRKLCLQLRFWIRNAA